MNKPKLFFSALLAGVAYAALAENTATNEPVTWQLLPSAQVDSAGIFLDQIILPPAATVVLPHLRLAQAPSLGQTASLSRNQITELAQKQCAGLITTNWSGATLVRVARRTRQFTDFDLTELLTASLQKDYVKNRGELELHLTRAWASVAVPDEPITLKISDLPLSGVSPNFVVNCELWCGRERLGAWQVAAQASVWREVPIARSNIPRGEALKDADITVERRDALVHRDSYVNYPTTDGSLEIAENLLAGQLLLNRCVRVRPTILRGRVVEAVFQDGALSISLKVETLEDGLLGQTVRVRNPKTKRELYGKVQNEQTVLIAL